MERHGDWPPLVMLLAALFGLSFLARPGSQPVTGEAGPAASPSAMPAAAIVERDEGGWLRGALPAVRLVAEHLGAVNDPALGLAASRDDAPALLAKTREEAARLGIGVRFVIATLPDYVDGNGGWDTDQRIEAIQKAAAEAGFAGDRFYLPGWAAERQTADRGSARAMHEVEPGALLFRRYGKAKELLLVLFATETATLGVHGDALLAAMALATTWSPDEPVRLIAPSFSGSSLSLRAALDRAFARGIVRTPVRIISGSATSLTNQARLTTPLDPDRGLDWPAVEFHSMTASDDDHLCAIQDYLTHTERSWATGRGIAILKESNTGYGRSFAMGTADTPGVQQLPCPSRFPNAYVFPFPAHISRLRAQAAAVHAGEAKLASEAHVRLKLDEAGTTDRVPAVEPELTSAMAEIVLANILDGIGRLHVSAVGILATDKRDHLFLAEEITRRAPGVLLFALEGNLIYLHPDYRSYMRGTLVVGSYPLFFPTQGRVGKHQFASMSAAGVYNALIAHLAAPDGLGGPESRVDDELLESLVDYGDCAGGPGPCGPAVWIGVVGRDALWPVRRVSRHELATRRSQDPADARRKDNLEYSWPRPRPQGGQGARAATLAEPAFGHPRAAVLAVLLVLATLVYLVAPWVVHRALGRAPRSEGLRDRLLKAGRALDMLYPPGMDLPWRPRAATLDGDRLQGLQREHLLGLVTCTAAAFCAAVWLATALLATYARLTPLWWSTFRLLSVIAVVVLGVLACFALQLAPRADRPFLLRRVFVAVPVLATLVLFGLSTPSPSLMGDLSAFNGLRFLTLSSLVSPTVPVLCMAAAVVAWGLWRLRQIQLQSAALGLRSPVTDLVWGSHPLGSEGVVSELNHPYLHVSAWGLGLVALAAVLQLMFGSENRCTSEGSAWFGWFLWAGATLVTVLMGFTLTHSVRVGRLLLGGLRALERHPLRLAFGTVHRLGLSWKYSLSPPGAYTLAPLVRQAGGLAHAVRDDWKRIRAEVPSGGAPDTGDARVVRRRRATDPASGPPTPSTEPDVLVLSRALRIRAGDVEALMSADAKEELGRHSADLRSPAFFHASALWSHLETLSEILVRSLGRGPWTESPYPGDGAAKATAEKDAGVKGSPAPRRFACHVEAETFLALQVACVIRLVLSRLLSGFTVVVGGLVLLLSAHLFYTFQGRPFWLAADGVLIAIATITIVRLLVDLEKDPILSRLWGTSPGRIGWTGGLSPRMVVYAGIAVLTVFASFFPEVGSSITRWLEPVRKSLP